MDHTSDFTLKAAILQNKLLVLECPLHHTQYSVTADRMIVINFRDGQLFIENTFYLCCKRFGEEIKEVITSVFEKDQ